MQESRSRPRSGRGAANGGGSVVGVPVDPVDRSDLLRRVTAFPFPLSENHHQEGIRLRRERRVCDSFSGIRRLARRSDG